MALYACGIAAIAAGKYALVARLLLLPDPGFTSPGSRGVAELPVVTASFFSDREFGTALSDERLLVPVSERLHAYLRPVLRQCLPEDRDYDRAFDLFEYLAALLFSHSMLQNWAPPGRFVWRWRCDPSVRREIDRELAERGARWGPLAAGLFDGDVQAFRDAQARIEATLGRL